jgi:DNA-binding transcriptional ArsR family regulator
MYKHRVPRPASDDSVFQAIACPTRRALLDTLASGERSGTALVASLRVTQSAVSQQLTVLKRAGLVAERAEGRFRYYRLRAEPLVELDVWLGRYRVLMERQLDALGRVLDAMPDEPDDKSSSEKPPDEKPPSEPSRKRRRS